ncbi:MAG TPA: hypothetical protein VHJ34_11990 [Actinomycetota bacterium]|nr:hypothetical protein [Actinomycetota bacterium]
MTITAPTRIITLTLALFALVLAGCGESEEDEFASDVNEICREATGDIRAAAGKRDELIAAVDRFIADLKAADPPEDQKDDYDAWVATQEKTFGELKSAIEANDQERIDAVSETAGDDQARELGLDDCTG